MTLYLNNKTYWQLVWTVPPKPPVHPEAMTGRLTFQHMKDALTFFMKAPKGSTLDSLTLVIEDHRDFTEDALSRVKYLKENPPCPCE